MNCFRLTKLALTAAAILLFANHAHAQSGADAPLMVIKSSSLGTPIVQTRKIEEYSPAPAPHRIEQLPGFEAYTPQPIQTVPTTTKTTQTNRRRLILSSYSPAAAQEELDTLRQELDEESEDDMKLLEPEEDDSDLDDLDDFDDSRKPQAQPFGAWPRKSIRSVNIDIREHSSVSPDDQSGQLTNMGYTPRVSSEKVFAWTAPNIRYQPLYFEDVALERYGQTQGPYRQSLSSAARFLKSAIALPNSMSKDDPYSCDHPLGFCRPGSQAPCVKQKHFFSR